MEKRFACECETWTLDPPFSLSTPSRDEPDGSRFIVRYRENWIDTILRAWRTQRRNGDARFFVGVNQRRLPVETAARTFRILFKLAGLKPEKGRIGPRPYDLRHAFAVRRLSRWYREGVDLHARLPWLSAYMGHVDIIGTETYLNTTPELLELAGNRLRRRYKKTAYEDDNL